MTKAKPPTYTPAPEPPADPELRRRYDEVMAVIGERQTVSEAARILGMSRNHFQTILHRAIHSIIESITPKPAGRPAKPEREAMLEEENRKLRTELEALKDRSAMIDRLMGVVGGIASGRTPLPRSRGRSKSKTKKTEDPEPEQAAASSLRQIAVTMRDDKVPVAIRMAIMGASESTIHRRARPTAPVARSPRTHALDAVVCQRVRSVVRDTRGLVGARSLSKRFGIPRRACAAIKQRELCVLELERKARCQTVSILAPGIVRGFDAMHVTCVDRKAYWLVAADGAIPYRTSITSVPVYDSKHVVSALRADFESHGPPLVIRLDRIACQRTPEVTALLAHYRVLALHGPPRHPGYYGQLERQNREHRAWLQHHELNWTELDDVAEAMRRSLNALWPRPTLNWCTAEEVWQRRVPVAIDRDELYESVESDASELVANGLDPLRARRFAIESALVSRGLLTINPGGWC